MSQKILYLHGFSSSGASGTVLTLRNMLYEKEVFVVAPDLPVSPRETLDLLRTLVEQEQPDLIIGTSMGAMYAELLRGRRRILVNPSFHMARSLTFKGLGKRPLLNKRADGAKEFMVDKAMIEEFKQLEKELSLQGVDDTERVLVYGLFGKNDTVANCQKDYLKHYGKEHFVLFDGEHHLNDKVISKVLKPLIYQLLSIS